MRAKIIIVDEEDSIVGHKERDTLKENDIYRVSALWVKNSKGEALLARRHRNKSHHPRKWGAAVTGTVDEGESYYENVIKETREEIGLENIKPKVGPKTKTDNEYHHFTQWYILNIDKDINEFKIAENEVEEIKWFTLKELKDQMENHPEEFIPSMIKYYELFSGE